MKDQNDTTEAHDAEGAIGSGASHGSPSSVEGVERRDIGYGIYVTKSAEEGVFIHFRLPDGLQTESGSKGTGFRVDNPNGMLGQPSLHAWALAVLNDQVFDS